MAAYDDLNVKRIFVVGVISVALTAFTGLAVQVFYYSLVQWQDAETAAASDYRRQNRILEEQKQEISNYGVDEATGNIIIPIEKAMELLVAESAENEESDQNASKTEKSGSDET
jgi:hypothetical protein